MSVDRRLAIVFRFSSCQTSLDKRAAPSLLREATITGRKSSSDKVADRIHREAIDWHVLLNGGTADAALRADFAAWRDSSLEHAEAYERLDALWTSPELAGALNEIADRSQPLSPRTNTVVARHWPMALAASVAVLALLAWQGPELLLRSQADFLTERGVVASHALPDGSTVTLNTGSAIATDFADGRRHVTLLRGEAFFDVLSDPDHPFTVSGLSSEVTVTGTAFSVETEAGEDRLTVAEGHVLFRGRQEAEPVEVVAGQTAEAGDATRPVPADVDVVQSLSWREGRIAIVDLPVWQALEELQRYRAAPVVLANLDRQDLTVTGDFRIDDIDGAVASLAVAAGLSATELPGSILLLH
jgi:transmembrane sensor